MLAKDALEESHLANEIEFVEDGEELMDYLCRLGQYQELKGSPLPGLILLDLNMPSAGPEHAQKRRPRSPRRNKG